MIQIYFLNALLWLVHPFFVSVTEVDHNAQTKSLEISIRTFTDDLEGTIRQLNPGKKVDLMNPPKDASMDSLINRYMIKKIKMDVNGQPGRMKYIGFERVEESIWTYFEITDVPVFKSLKVQNEVLYEYKKEQINMMHVKKGDQRQSRKLDNPEADWTFTF